MTREELASLFKDVEDGKRAILETMYDDFIYEHEQLENIKEQMKKVEQPKSQREADKLRYFSRLYSEVSSRHESKIRIFLSALQKYDMTEDNPIAAWIRERQNK